MSTLTFVDSTHAFERAIAAGTLERPQDWMYMYTAISRSGLAARDFFKNIDSRVYRGGPAYRYCQSLDSEPVEPGALPLQRTNLY